MVFPGKRQAIYLFLATLFVYSLILNGEYYSLGSRFVLIKPYNCLM